MAEPTGNTQRQTTAVHVLHLSNERLMMLAQAGFGISQQTDWLYFGGGTASRDYRIMAVAPADLDAARVSDLATHQMGLISNPAGLLTFERTLPADDSVAETPTTADPDAAETETDTAETDATDPPHLALVRGPV